MNRAPRIGDTLLIGDDPHLLAELSSLLGRARTYTPVFDGPRMFRNDASIEITLRNNAAARSKARKFVLAGMADDSSAEFLSRFPAGRTFCVRTLREAVAAGVVRERSQKLRVPRTRLGTALLAALRDNHQLEFDDEAPDPAFRLNRGRAHLVVCEEGDLHAQVVAANYAHALDADLVLIPEIAEEVAESLLGELYGVYEQSAVSATDAMQGVIAELRALASLDLQKAESITFFTAKLPWGFAFQELPSSHIFNFPSVGLAVFNGLQGVEQSVRICVGIDPAQVQATEVEATAKALASRGAFACVRRGPRANVRDVSRTIELYPYDLLLISTHCGDADGYRWTYRFPDRQGCERTFVVDVAISVAEIPGNDNLEVITYKKFVSLDGVDWSDREAKKRLPVGTALLDYFDQIRADPPLEPIHKEEVARVHGSAALRLFDGNYLSAVRTLADGGTPIVINNACASWHELAARFAFADCRMYAGTLFSVSNAEAQEVIKRVMHKHLGKPLPLAFWHSQRDVYGSSPRRPYAVMGVYFQPLRTAASNAPRIIADRMQRALIHWTQRLSDTTLTAKDRFTITDYTHYLESELTGLTRGWPS